MAERCLSRLLAYIVAAIFAVLGFSAQGQETKREGPRIPPSALKLPDVSLPAPPPGKPDSPPTKPSLAPPDKRKAAEGLPERGDDRPVNDLDRRLVPTTISRLNAADRKLVLDTIALARAFRDEVATRERAYRDTYLTRDGLEKTLVDAFKAEGAARSHPSAAEHDSFAGVAEKGFGSRHKRIAAELFKEGGGSLAALRPGNTPDVDWLKAEGLLIEYIYARKEESGDSLFAQWILMPLRFYSTYTKRLDGVLGDTGNRAEDGSIFFGLEAVRGSQVISPVFPATFNDGEWRLDAAMREAVREITVYLEKARAAWRAYDRIIATDYPLLVTRLFARRARLLQESVRLHAQAAFYGDLPSLYIVRDGTPIANNIVFMRKRRDSALFEYIEYEPPKEGGWIARHLKELKAIDAKASCRAGLTVRPEPIASLGQGIFVDPIFHVVERAQTIPDGAKVQGRVWGFAPHIKGKMEKAVVAALPKGLHDMPAGGGIVLEVCAVKFPKPGAGTKAEVAPAVGTRTAFGAANEALP